jgi:glycosyltransferase involved in cell wall biosynthesis
MPNGVETECFVHRACMASPRRLLFVGQWLPAKGIRYLVDAFAALSRHSEVELVCVGTRVHSDVVVNSFPPTVRQRVTVVPDVGRTELHQLLSDSVVFVFPSLSEGFSKALLEAMAAGLPIVATPAGAAVDILVDGHNALVVPFADSSAIVSAVQRLWTDGQLRERLGDAARTTATSYSLDATTARFLATVSAVAERCLPAT